MKPIYKSRLAWILAVVVMLAGLEGLGVIEALGAAKVLSPKVVATINSILAICALALRVMDKHKLLPPGTVVPPARVTRGPKGPRA